MALIEVQLHTLLPAKIAEVKDKLSGPQTEKAARNVAQYLLNRTQGTFAAQADPWGTAWIPSQRALGYPKLQESHRRAMDRYNARKAAAGKGWKGGRPPKAPPKGGGQTLLDTGRLRKSFEIVKRGGDVLLTVAKSAGGGTARAGFKAHGAVSNVVYFPTHQFGYPAKNIPARPMLPIKGDALDLPETYRTAIRNVLDIWVKGAIS
jgi:phage gpG-like protein